MDLWETTTMTKNLTEMYVAPIARFLSLCTQMQEILLNIPFEKWKASCPVENGKDNFLLLILVCETQWDSLPFSTTTRVGWLAIIISAPRYCLLPDMLLSCHSSIHLESQQAHFYALCRPITQNPRRKREWFTPGNKLERKQVSFFAGYLHTFLYLKEEGGGFLLWHLTPPRCCQSWLPPLLFV